MKELTGARYTAGLERTQRPIVLHTLSLPTAAPFDDSHRPADVPCCLLSSINGIHQTWQLYTRPNHAWTEAAWTPIDGAIVTIKQLSVGQVTTYRLVPRSRRTVGGLVIVAVVCDSRCPCTWPTQQESKYGKGVNLKRTTTFDDVIFND